MFLKHFPSCIVTLVFFHSNFKSKYFSVKSRESFLSVVQFCQELFPFVISSHPELSFFGIPLFCSMSSVVIFCRSMEIFCYILGFLEGSSSSGPRGGSASRTFSLFPARFCPCNVWIAFIAHSFVANLAYP